MTISNPTNAFTKQVGEDSVNGMPIRLADSAGALPATTSRVTVLASAAYIASGVASAQSPSGLYNELLLFLKVTAVSGTTPTLNVFVDASDDGGTSWYQIAQLGPTNVAAVPAQTQSAYPSGYTLALGAGLASGLFGDTWRIRYQITGTTPSFTFSVQAIYKNST